MERGDCLGRLIKCTECGVRLEASMSYAHLSRPGHAFRSPCDIPGRSECLEDQSIDQIKWSGLLSANGVDVRSALVVTLAYISQAM